MKKIRLSWFWYFVFLPVFWVWTCNVLGAIERLLDYPLTFFVLPLVIFTLVKVGIFAWNAFAEATKGDDVEA